METKLPYYCGPVVADLGKKSMEWDLNDWRWDGDSFLAAPQTSDLATKIGASNGFSSGLDEGMMRKARENKDLEVTDELNGEAASLNLKLGGQMFPVIEDKLEAKKKARVSCTPSNRAVCQVDDCKADLSNAKDYHRRHKVCEAHSKAARALIGNVLKRFCQQCSRFHVLQEFDEGKRSCRRRLAGHNKRRRKTHPESVVNALTLNDEQSSNYVLVSLLRILSNIHATSSAQTKDQDLLSLLLKNLSSFAGSTNGMSSQGLLPQSHDLQKMETADSTREADRALAIASSTLAQKNAMVDQAQGGVTQNASASQQSSLLIPGKAVKANPSDTTARRVDLNNFDLNNVYDVSQDCIKDMLDNVVPENFGNASTVTPLWPCKDLRHSSPPQSSGDSGSPSTSSGEAQSRTDRIVFKLFGKEPSGLPLTLRKQILDWLSSSPTDMESYIRPGCVVLTIYVCMDGSTWDELYYNLNFSLRKLLDSSSDPFWRTGWIYAQVQNCATFAYNGVVLDTPFPLEIHGNCSISIITPLAVTFSEVAHFVVKGFHLSRSTSRLHCAVEGKYLVEESCYDMAGGDSFIEHGEMKSLGFSCAIPNIVGRGFIEVEENGLSNSFFPFIVAEKDICSEICNLEAIIVLCEFADEDTNKLEARQQALNFVHEMGWLLHKSNLMLRSKEMRGNIGLFPFERFKWLVEYAIDHSWSAVVKKLLNIVSDGSVDAGQYTSIIDAVQSIGLLHCAVRNNSMSMVELLIAYHPSGMSTNSYWFRPDCVGPGGLTPLHIAASLDSCESIVDALTNDPGSVGIGAWKTAHDSMGLTPHDYAGLRGHYSYNHLVQRKTKSEQVVVVDIGGDEKQKMGKAHGMEMVRCMECEAKLGYGRQRVGVRIYRPAMLSLVAIAAVCVCAALLFKSSPEVIYSFRPFRWELLKYGSE